ncbi:MAG: hypothetical protein A3E19_06775 [Planctomycetes bacterium RIFCSPHIGHO2_12_FULL_52_36]|nr:MAG: hypothetical protein A3E19_06775 [Planctomycetes bacterium RIFCSPHIGHO2_12_FULL_52_36]
MGGIFNLSVILRAIGATISTVATFSRKMDKKLASPHNESIAKEGILTLLTIYSAKQEGSREKMRSSARIITPVKTIITFQFMDARACQGPSTRSVRKSAPAQAHQLLHLGKKTNPA